MTVATRTPVDEIGPVHPREPSEYDCPHGDERCRGEPETADCCFECYVALTE